MTVWPALMQGPLIESWLMPNDVRSKEAADDPGAGYGWQRYAAGRGGR